MLSAIRAIMVLATIAPLCLAAEALSPGAQNALVQKYCAVCHTDASRNGGLSLEHYDAGQPNPPLAAMLLGKLKTGAMGAAGIGLPAPDIQHAWTEATAAQAEGADRWHISRISATVIASVVREIPTTSGVPDSYRLSISCRPATREASIELAWSPGVPPTGQMMSAEIDGRPFSTYKLDGIETNGNGMAGSSRAGYVVLSATSAPMPMPAESLRIRDAFPGQTLTFPFTDLPPDGRAALADCFPASLATR